VKILFITDNFPPEVNAPATRTYEHALRWVARGASVTVMTCAPNFPRGRVFEGYRNRLRSVEVRDGIRIVRVWSYMAANEGFLKRTLDYASFAVTAAIAGLFERADVIVATSPQFFTTFAARFLAMVRRRPWVFEVRDLWPESLVAVGAMQPSRLIRMLERIELALYRSAARIVVVTPAFRHNLVARGIDPSKIAVVTNGVDVSDWQLRPADPAFRSRIGASGKFLIGYIGTHGMAHGLDFIVRNAATLPEAHFLFVGDGAERDALVSLAHELGVPNATFLAAVPKQEVANYLANVDAVLVPLRKSETFRSVIPSKIFEAAAMEKPILLGVEGQAEAIVTAHNAGIAFEPENADSFAAAVRRLSSDREHYLRIVEGCRDLARTYDRNRLADCMLDVLQQATGRHALPTER
jgi:glycosyltransferase involved in cell wall biosynthesis